MRFSTLASVALAAAPALVAADGTLGFALGTKNGDGTCKDQAAYESDFDAISAASGSKLVRGYSASDCNCAQSILPAAAAKGFTVVLGIWYAPLSLKPSESPNYHILLFLDADTDLLP